MGTKPTRLGIWRHKTMKKIRSYQNAMTMCKVIPKAAEDPGKTPKLTPLRTSNYSSSLYKQIACIFQFVSVILAQPSLYSLLNQTSHHRERSQYQIWHSQTKRKKFKNTPTILGSATRVLHSSLLVTIIIKRNIPEIYLTAVSDGRTSGVYFSYSSVCIWTHRPPADTSYPLIKPTTNWT